MSEATPNRFHGLTGWAKTAASLGVIGLFAVLTIYVVLWELPAERAASRAELRAEREAARLEAAKSREHGQQAAREIGDGMKELADLLIEMHWGVGPRLTSEDKKRE